MRKAALVSALSEIAASGALTIVDELEATEYKTKTVAGILSALGVAGEKVLVVTDDAKPMLEASLRNLPGVSLVRAEGLNVYDCLRHSKLVMTKAALSALEARLLARKDEVDPT